MAEYILVGVIATVVLVEVVFLLLFLWYHHKEHKNASNRSVSNLPKVAVISPHYGWNSEIEKHTQKIFSQNYQGEFEVYYVTHKVGDTGYDNSYEYLKNISDSHNNCRVLLAPNVIESKLSCGQKVQNQITVIEQLPEDIDVIAFIDADANISKKWLTQLVAPLNDENIGATYGSRFYIPHTFNIPSMIESVWVNMEATQKGSSPVAWVWGGSFAMRKSIIKKTDMLHYLKQTVSDDIVISQILRKNNYKLHHVSDCAPHTYMPARSISQVLEFTNRQMFFGLKVADVKLTWIFCLLGINGKLISHILLFQFVSFTSALSVIIMAYLIESLMFYLLLKGFPKSIRKNKVLKKQLLLLCLVTPISIALTGVNAIAVTFKSTIRWGNYTYRIKSAYQTEIVDVKSKS